MKPLAVWLILGAGTLLCCSGALLLGTRFYSGYSAASAEATSFADKELPLILKDWNVQELEAHASREFKRDVPPEILKSYLDLYSKNLGKYESVSPSKTAGYYTYSGTNGAVQTANVTADASFFRDNGTVTLMLVKRNGEWQIYGFGIKARILENLGKS